MFTRAIVRTPARTLAHGVTTSKLGPPDYATALQQHQSYRRVLEECGLEVTVLPPNDDFPDSTFVEDTALLTHRCAIVTNPGVASRKRETVGMKDVLTRFFSSVEQVTDPGTVDGGDIMMVGDHFYIGLSQRTNQEGVDQVIRFLQKHGMSGSVIGVKEALHLKTGLAYLENDNLMVSGEFRNKPEFRRFNKIPAPEGEGYAANCIWVNGTVVIPSGHPKTGQLIQGLGYPVRETPMTEFQKLDGGLSCLSLRF